MHSNALKTKLMRIIDAYLEYLKEKLWEKTVKC